MKQILLPIFAFLLFVFGCKDDTPEPVNLSPKDKISNKLQRYRDSMIDLYGTGIKSPDKILSIYREINDTLGNTFLSGRTVDGYWLGVFDETRSLLTEKYYKIPDSLNFTTEDSVFIYRNFPSNNPNAFVLEGFILDKSKMGFGDSSPSTSTRVLVYYNYDKNKFYNTYQFDHGQIRKITPWYHGSFVITNNYDLNPDAIATTYYLDSALQPIDYGDPETFHIPGGTSDLILSYTEYLTVGWEKIKGITASRKSIYLYDSGSGKSGNEIIWEANKAISNDIAGYYYFHKHNVVEIEHSIEGDELTVTASISGIIRDCLECEAKANFDTTYSLKVNIETGEEVK